ncbi:MAG: adenylate/guanylate cyclase domain-containing protein [Mycobacterium sp.]
MSVPSGPAESRAEPTFGTTLTGRLRNRTPRKGLLGRVSIQSKLLLMLLTMSVLATAIAGGIGFQSGRSSLRESVFERLTATREAQARLLERGLSDLTSSLVINAHGETIAAALGAFTGGFDQLNTATVTPDQSKSILDFYTARFGTEKSNPDNGKLDINALVPTSNAAKYLQANFTVPAGERQPAARVGDTAVGSAWSVASDRYNNYFSEIVTRSGFADAFLIDARGNVVYTLSKGVELGTNVLSGPYRGEGNLPDAFRKAMATNEIDYSQITDFAEYLPSGQPTAWMLTPIGPPGRVAGVIALEFPIAVLNNLMTADRQWDRAGMGRTGETYLVGHDDLMRSDSRLFLQDPQAYKSAVIASGTAPAVAARAITQGTTVLVQPVGTAATQAAQRGETGTLIATDYLGHRALQAYSPLSLKGLDWIIIASLDSQEAFAPERNFAHRLARNTAFIIFIACLASMLWARIFVRPIKRLESGAEQISSGNYDLTIPVESDDEFGSLTVAFNEMSHNLSIKEQLLTEQRTENDKLLRSLMPDSVVERYRDGEETIAEDHQDVTVIYADLLGLDEMSDGLSAAESLEVINKLARQFDAAADSHGVERVRNTHNGYLASCGLTVPRLDNIVRTVDFAFEMQRIVDRFNAETGRSIALRAGVDTGTVTSGLVGRAGLMYDLWGGAVQLASKLRRGAAQPGVYVTDDVHDATQDTKRYESAGTITVGDREEPIWRLAEDQA